MYGAGSKKILGENNPKKKDRFVGEVCQGELSFGSASKTKDPFDSTAFP